MKDIFEILKGHSIEVPEDKIAEIRKAVAENYKTINEFNTRVDKLNDDLKTANKTITDLNDKIKEFDGVDIKGLQDTIQKYKDDEAARKDAEEKAATLKALKDRFAPLRGDKEFLNEGTEQWMFSEFEKAVALDENKGKGDTEIFEAITKDKNIYKNPNTVYQNPPAGGGASDDDAKARAVMGLSPKKD